MFSPFEQLKSMFITDNCFGKDLSITNMTLFLFHCICNTFNMHLATKKLALIPNNWQSLFEMIIVLFRPCIRTGRTKS